VLPARPNAARDSARVGAEPRLPAIETSPTSRNDATAPTTAATMPCQSPIPKPSTNAPYDTASTEMFEAHHGQNRSAGLPLRSDSWITLMPLASMAPGAAGALRVDDSSMAVMSFPFSPGPRAAGPSSGRAFCDGHHLARVDPRVVTLDGRDRRQSEHLETAFSSRDRLGTVDIPSTSPPIRRTHSASARVS
jgi:hypothetical protein